MMSGGLGVSCEFFPTMCNALATLDDLTYDSDRECQTPDPAFSIGVSCCGGLLCCGGGLLCCGGPPALCVAETYR